MAFVVCCLWFAGFAFAGFDSADDRCMMCVVYGFLRFVYCMLLAVCYLVVCRSKVSWLLCVVRCSLFVVCCLLFVVCCLRCVVC